MSGETQVREHFEADAERFDAIYDDAKGPLRRFVDDHWRGVVRERFKLVLERLSPTEGLAVLDVGTGSGWVCARGFAAAAGARGECVVVTVAFGECL